MSHVAISGLNGFLGWHLRAALLESNRSARGISMGDKFDLVSARSSISGSESAIHLAGINRGNEKEISEGNILFAKQFSEATLGCEVPPNEIVFANSIQANNGSVYGDSKKRAAEILFETASKLGIKFRNVLIPNVFGEHGKPFYNSVTATFCFQIANALETTVDQNKDLTLVHAQDVVDHLIGKTSLEAFEATTVKSDVLGLLKTIADIGKTYSFGNIPDLNSNFHKNLFNTYRSYVISNRTSIPLAKHTDERGSFFEIVKVLDGGGQSSFSTTVPGVTRGDHFHRRKIERFTVLEGEAVIKLRKLFTNEVVEVRASGSEPISVDMPTMWTHNITNTGKSPLLTSFWINEIFDPTAPDTIYEKVTI